MKINSRGHGDDVVLLLHGFLGSGRNLGSLARRWSERDTALRILLPDLPGHGKSAAPAQPSLEAVAGELLQLIKTTQPRRLVGHSFGGLVSLAARLLEPEAVPPLTLLDISPSAPGALAAKLYGDGARGPVMDAFFEAPERAESREHMSEWLRTRDVAEPLVQWLVLNLQRDAGGVSWRVDRGWLAQLHDTYAHVDLWAAVEERPGDTRCIRGGGSPYVSDRDARRLESANCPVDTVEGAGHFVHMDEPERLLELLV